MPAVNMRCTKESDFSGTVTKPGRQNLNRSALSFAVISALLLGCSAQASADIGLHKKAPEEGGYVGVKLFAHAGFSSVDYSYSRSMDASKDSINNSLPYYYIGAVGVDPSYKFGSDTYGPIEVKLHSVFQLSKSFLDDDQVNKLSVEVNSKRYGLFYLGEDDGAARRLQAKQSGKVGIAVGHGAFTGIIPWWGNLPYQGGSVRRDNTYDWDWSNGIVGGDWRSNSRNTQHAVKFGYQSPALSGFKFGASMNLQNTYQGFTGPGSAPIDQDSWSHIGLKHDEYEMALQWNGRTASGLNLSAGLTHASVHMINADMLQKDTDAGFKVGKKLDSGAVLSSSVYYAYQQYDNDVANIHTHDSKVSWGLDWKKGKWKVGANYIKAWDSYIPPANRQSGGGGNEGYSLGADYKLARGLTLGTGIIYAKNDAGEKATEVGMNLTYHFRSMIY